jgi:tRNA(Ile)-lysidine synthase
LDLSRQDVLKYLEEKNLPYRTDSTNKDIAFFRNRIRQKLIPLLDEFFPSWRTSLLALAETQALTAEFLASEAGKRLTWEKSFSAESGLLLSLPEEDFLKAPPILREEALFAGADMLASGENRCPRRAALRRAVADGSIEDLGPVRLEKKEGFILLKSAGHSARYRGKKGFSLLIKEAGIYTLKGKVLNGGKSKLIIRPGTYSEKSYCFSAVFPLVFRNHRESDCIYRGGRKRRLSDILDSKERSRYTNIITACDAEGPAAFVAIGKKLLVLSRDKGAHASNAGESCCFEVSVE